MAAYAFSLSVNHGVVLVCFKTIFQNRMKTWAVMEMMKNEAGQRKPTFSGDGMAVPASRFFALSEMSKMRKRHGFRASCFLRAWLR
ncbi:hypothetical protein [Comamonas sp.]